MQPGKNSVFRVESVEVVHPGLKPLRFCRLYAG